MSSASANLDAAMGRLVDGEVQPGDDALVAEAMKNDAAIVERLRAQLEIDAMLRQGAEPSDESFVEGVAARLEYDRDEAFVERVRRSTVGSETLGNGSTRRVRLLLLVTVTAACVLLGFLALSRPEVRTPVLAEVVYAEPDSEYAVGQRIELNELTLARGELTLRLETGVQIDCAGPVDLRLESPMRLHLRQGQLDIDVGQHGFGFTVITPAGDVVDLGTRFRVTTGEGDEVKVAVISGKVEVRRKQTPTISLGQGESVSVHRSGRPQRVQTVQLRGRRDPEHPMRRSSVIKSVSDNMTVEGMNRFYGVVPGGMQPGATAFADRPGPKWKSLRGKDFPGELVGADLVQTFQSERWSESFELQLDVTRPSVVYLLRDPRNPTPKWLARDFEDTGLRLRAVPWTGGNITKGLEPMQNDKFEIPCEVWRREVASSGVVKLGLPYDDRATVHAAMYGIAVRAVR